MKLQNSQETVLTVSSRPVIDLDPSAHSCEKFDENSNNKMGAVGLLSADSDRSSFYTRTGESMATEGRRLKSMADIYRNMSVGLIGSVEGRTVLDAGAGNSSSLGVNIENTLGGKYLALDIRPDAVEDLKNAGLNARVAGVTETGLDSNSADVVHSRLTWGWLSTAAERQAAFREAVRVLSGESRAGSESRMVIMDANWEVKNGPREFIEAVKATSDCMAGMGFDPFYGHKLGQELRQWSYLDSKNGLQISAVGSEKMPIFSGRIIDIMPHIKEVGDSVIGGLIDLGREDQAAKLQDLYSKLNNYAEDNPDAEVEGINMVAHVLIIKKDEDYRRSEQSSPERQVSSDSYVEGLDFDLADPANFGLKNVVVAKSPEMILAARRIQADAYVRKGLVRADALKSGVLPSEIDPADQIERSKYFLTLDDQKRICGMVRCIEPDSDNSAESLPGAKNMGLDRDLESTVVISAFARNFDVKSSFADPVVAAIGLVDYVRGKGYKNAIMELESGQQMLIDAVFGKGSLSPRGSGKIQLSGVKQNKSYVYLIGETEKFINSVWSHVDKNVSDPTKDETRLRPLFKKMHLALEHMLDPKTSR